MTIKRFEEIEAWQLSRELTKRIYLAAKSNRFSRDYGLRDQICRASVSVMSNIAEGFNSGSRAEFARFLSYAQRSCSEVQSQLYVALDQGYIDQRRFQEFYELSAKTAAKVGAFIKYLRQTKHEQPRTNNESRRTKHYARYRNHSRSSPCPLLPYRDPSVPL